MSGNSSAGGPVCYSICCASRVGLSAETRQPRLFGATAGCRATVPREPFDPTVVLSITCGKSS